VSASLVDYTLSLIPKIVASEVVRTTRSIRAIAHSSHTADATTRRHRGHGSGLPGFFGDRRRGGYQQRCCADRVLQRAAEDLGRTDHASIVGVLEFLAAHVEAEIVLALL
jgi:hypothetical protein